MNGQVASLLTCRNCSAILFPMISIHGYSDEENGRRFFHVSFEECCYDRVYFKRHRVYCENCRKRVGTRDEYDEQTLKFCETRIQKIRFRVRFNLLHVNNRSVYEFFFFASFAF